MFSFVAAPTPSPVVNVVILDEGWLEPSVLIGILSAMFTIIALLFAYRSNLTAKASLTSALRIQEQSKNTELLDKRVGIYKVIKSFVSSAVGTLQDLSFDVQVLFNDAVLGLFQTYITAVSTNEKAQQNMRDYLQERKDQTGVVCDDDLPEVIAEMNHCSHDKDRELYQEYLTVCNSTAFSYDPSYGDGECEVIWLNYHDISMMISSTTEAAKGAKERLLEEISHYIKETIKQIES